MISAEDLNSRRGSSNNLQEIKNDKENINTEKRLNQINTNMVDGATNSICTPTFLRTQIGKLIKVEFLVGTNNIVDKIGFLEEVGTNYILLRAFEGDSQIYADIYSIKFITIFISYNNINTPQNINNIGMQNVNWNTNRYY